MYKCGSGRTQKGEPIDGGNIHRKSGWYTVGSTDFYYNGGEPEDLGAGKQIRKTGTKKTVSIPEGFYEVGDTYILNSGNDNKFEDLSNDAVILMMSKSGEKGKPLGTAYQEAVNYDKMMAKKSDQKLANPYVEQGPIKPTGYYYKAKRKPTIHTTLAQPNTINLQSDQTQVQNLVNQLGLGQNGLKINLVPNQTQ